ncbi:MAG: integrase family protein [Myxococcaceae bacterium]|nr:integrase family protein [Myxococcaceae bacterium]
MQLALWPSDTAVPPPRKLAKRPAMSRAVPPRPASAAQALELVLGLEERASHYEKNAHTDGTRKSYQRDWDAFERWCAQAGHVAMPAGWETLRLYLTHLAELGRRPSTIRHARKSIGLAHAHAGAPRPDRDERIRTLERGIACELGSREVGVVPLLEHELARAVATLRHSPRDDRDRALILLGFSGAFRAADLAGLTMDSVKFTPEGMRIFLARSKEDRIGEGSHTDIPRGAQEETCPVKAMRSWLARVGRPSGPLFRVVHGAQIEHQRISTRAVARAVQRVTERAGLQGHYAAHSLRSGLATSAHAHGHADREIQAHGRWKDRRSLDRYIDVERIAGRRNVAEGLL